MNGYVQRDLGVITGNNFRSLNTAPLRAADYVDDLKHVGHEKDQRADLKHEQQNKKA